MYLLDGGILSRTPNVAESSVVNQPKDDRQEHCTCANFCRVNQQPTPFPTGACAWISRLIASLASGASCGIILHFLFFTSLAAFLFGLYEYGSNTNPQQQ